jgi:hypothetical protein
MTGGTVGGGGTNVVEAMPAGGGIRVGLAKVAVAAGARVEVSIGEGVMAGRVTGVRLGIKTRSLDPGLSRNTLQAATHAPIRSSKMTPTQKGSQMFDFLIIIDRPRS